MLLTVLGCWAPYPRPGEACSGYLIQNERTNIMLEAGNGSFAELTKHIPYRNLAGLVITHFHPDHYADIYCLRHAVEGARREGLMDRAVKLFLPRNPQEVAEKLSGFDQAFETIFIDDLPNANIKGQFLKTASVGDFTLFFLPTLHSLPGYSVLVADRKSKTLLYSGDTGRTELLENTARNADCFLCEASGLDKDANYLKDVHLTARQAGELAKAAMVKRLLITHFWPEYDVNKLLEDARESFKNEVEAVVQGKKYYI